MFRNKRTYAVDSGCADECAAPSEREPWWRSAERARRKVFGHAGKVMEERRERLGGHADFNRMV